MKKYIIAALTIVVTGLFLLNVHVFANESNDLTKIYLKAMKVDDKKLFRPDYGIFADYLSEHKYINQYKPDGSYDMADYHVLKKSATIMGHKLIFLENEWQQPNLGCCANEGIVVALLVTGSHDKLENFAEKNFCSIQVLNRIQSITKLFWKPRKSPFKPGKYVWLDCRYTIDRNSEDEESVLESGSVENQNSASQTQEHDATDAITNEDLDDCRVLLGQKKAVEFQHHMKLVKELADNGDLDNGIYHAAIMHNRFVCNEDEILGEQQWETIIENDKGKIVQHIPRKTIPSIKTHPKAFMALKDAVEAYTRIAERDLGSHLILGQHYADYNEALGNSQVGYLLVSQAYEAICHQKNVMETNKGRCKTLDRLKPRYKSMVSPEDRNKLDQQAAVWAKEFLKSNKNQ